VTNEHLTQTVDIETPELVVVSYTIAGLGSRVYAALIDLVICIIFLIGAVTALVAVVPKPARPGASANAANMSTAWAFAILVLVQFALLWGYYLLFEALRDGQTPGKRVLGLRAVRDGGFPVGFSASAVRNLMRLIDLQPGFTYLVGIGSIALSKSGKRLGDMVAGTLVVRETLTVAPNTAPPPRAEAGAPLTAQLSDAEFTLLTRWGERRGTLEGDRRRALTTQVAERLRRALPPDERASDGSQLVRLLGSERTACAHGAAARGTTGARRERYAIVASRSPRWVAFAARLTEAQRRGLKALGEDGVRAFVSDYRALAADLARLRTAAHGEASDEVFYLGRLVAGAHNILYRERRSTLKQLLKFVGVDVPTEIRRSFRPILLAAAFMFGPAIIAYTAVVQHPSVAPVFIPTGMLDRAEAGVERAKRGDGYIPDPETLRPVMASRIIANNVQVTIATFAFGVTAGLGTLLLLLLNGISLGGVFGLYASKGILPLLVAFVAPHGVLELSAICIGAGGGLLIGAAMLIPGQRTRRRALAENSARAMRLLAGAALFLLVAGSLEGMVSPIPYWPLSLKLIVSATTLVLMIAYLRGGAGLQQPVSLDLEIPVDDGGGHAVGRDVEHRDAGAPHAAESLLSLPNELLGRGAPK
jgi:uncharacterized membrane protein SpoIIM required for sporulation/uncharacterized RDD family membrane protein YckC